MLLYSRNQFMKYLLKYSFTARRVARIWKGGGGAILKEWELCKRPWLEFSLNLNQFQTVCPKIKTKFFGKLGNSKVFSAENQVFSKKIKKVFTEIESDFSAEVRNSKVFTAQNQVFSKKIKKVFTEIESDFSAENPKFKDFFRSKSGVLLKKKRSSLKLRVIFRPKSEIQRFFPPKIRCYLKKKGLHRNWDWFFVQFSKFRRLRGGCFRMGGGGAIFNFSQKIGLKSTKNMRFCILHEPMGGLEPPLATLLFTAIVC